MFLKIYKSYLFALLTTFSPLVAMKSSQTMCQHLATLNKTGILSFNKLTQKERHKLLLTAYHINEKTMLPIYLNDWALKQCTKSSQIAHNFKKNITSDDIEKHLKKAHQFKLPHNLYQQIGKKMAEFYIIPHIKKQAKNFTPQLKNAVDDLEQKINQSMSIILIYTYDARCAGQPTLQIPNQSNAGKILKKLKPNTQKVLGQYLNFKIV